MTQGVVPMLAYRDGPAAMDWLISAFGFRELRRWLADDGSLSHGELATGAGSIMLATPSPEYEGPARHRANCPRAAAWSRVPWVVDGVLVHVVDIDEHFRRALAGGAVMLGGVEDGPEDSRLYRCEDLEGHRWMFMQPAGPFEA